MRRFGIIVSAAAILAAVSCADETAKVKAAAYGFSEAMANYRVDDAEGYAAEEMMPMIRFSKRLVASVDSSYIANDTPAVIEITSVELTSDTTAVASYHKETPIKKLDGTVGLVKRNGCWKVKSSR